MICERGSCLTKLLYLKITFHKHHVLYHKQQLQFYFASTNVHTLQQWWSSTGAMWTSSLSLHAHHSLWLLHYQLSSTCARNLMEDVSDTAIFPKRFKNLDSWNCNMQQNKKQNVRKWSLQLFRFSWHGPIGMVQSAWFSHIGPVGEVQSKWSSWWGLVNLVQLVWFNWSGPDS